MACGIRIPRARPSWTFLTSRHSRNRVPPRIVVVSGPIDSGKSSLAARLEARFGTKTFSSLGPVKDAAAPDTTREALQVAGARLDRSTRGRWIADALALYVTAQGLSESEQTIVVDAVRTKEQIAAVRVAFGR